MTSDELLLLIRDLYRAVAHGGYDRPTAEAARRLLLEAGIPLAREPGEPRSALRDAELGRMRGGAR
jgi:hypothetical protein